MDLNLNSIAGLSLVATIKQCICFNNHKAAASFKRTFGLSDARFYWIKIQALAESKSWEALDEFAGERSKSPIGWEPFLEVAKKHHAPREYLAR